MNFVYILIAVIVLGGGYYALSDKAEDAQVAPMVSQTEVEVEAAVEEDTMTTEDHANMDMSDAEDEMLDTTVSKESSVIDEASAVAVSDEIEEAVAQTHVFDVGGVNFAFDVTEIKVKEGDTVTINFESNDGFHDWVVDEFDAATERVRPGTPTSFTFVADKKGIFEYYCSVGSHRANGMVGNLIVE
ncbi:MAG: plastocyanin [Candidatus Azotimanducaceae bacterium]|jgi:plastocyanin